MKLFKHLLIACGAFFIVALPGNGWAQVVINPATIPDPVAGVFYSQTFTASGGVAPYSFLATTVLPSGLTMTGDTLSGVPTVSGAFTITVLAQDSSGFTVCVFNPCPPNTPSFFPLPQTGTQTYNVNIASNVPTLSEWAMILLGLMLAGGAAHHLWRRQAYQAA